MDAVTLGLAKADTVRRLSRGERLRRAASMAYRRNSLEQPVMTSPPTITSGAANLDATLTKSYLFSTSAATLASVKTRGGVPTLNGGVYYRFPVVTLPSGTGNATSTQNAVDWSVEFMTDSSKIQFIMQGSGTSNGAVFEVDDQAVSLTPTLYTSSTPTYFLMDFTSVGGRAIRKIRIDASAAAGIRGVQVLPTASVWPVADPNPIKVASVGDSISARTGTDRQGWQVQLGKLMGWSEVRQYAIGGTGVITVANGSTIGDATRVADVATFSPDVVLFMVSTNDTGQTDAAITAAWLATLQAHRAANPRALFVLGGIWGGTSGPSASYLAAENAAKAAFDSWADRNSFFIPISTDTTGAWIFGTGRSGATNSSGNSDVYVGATTGSDTIHPTPLGHDFLARRWARALRESVIPNVTV